MYFDTNNITANQGSTLSIPVMFGSSSAMVNDVYGIAGTINILNAQTSTPISLSNTTSWIGNNTNSILFTKKYGANKIRFCNGKK